MSATYIVSTLNTDFTTDIENLVIAYLYQEWSLTGNLAKPALAHGEGQDIEFRPGFDRGRPSFQVLCVQTDTEVIGRADVSNRSWQMLTRLEITVITNVMGDLDNVRPELGYMEREVQRILNQYQTIPTFDIPGIYHMEFMGQTRIYDDIYVGASGQSQVRGGRGGSGGRSGTGPSWDKTRWKSLIRAEVRYVKDDIS